MRLRKPATQFGQGGVWPCRNLRLDRLIKPGQLRLDMATLRPGRQFTRLAAAGKDLGHIRDRDAQGFGDLPDRLSGIAAGKDTVAKILRVSHPTSPSHPNLRSTPTRGRRIASHTRFASVFTIPVTPSTL